MKGFRLLLTLCLSTLSASAEALPVGVPFNLMIPFGRDPSDARRVGSIVFELDGEEEGACRYWGLWDNQVGAASAECWVEELEVHGAASCAANSQRGVDTMLRASRELPCAGFSRGFGAPREVFQLIALESAEEPSLIGLIQWTAAAPYLSPIEGVGVP